MTAELRHPGWVVSGLLVLYLILSLAPLALVLAIDPPSRGFWVEFSCALGFVGFAMMALLFSLTTRFHWVSLVFGQDTVLHMHRQAGILAVSFVLAHPLIAIAADPAYLAFFDPRENLPRAGALNVVSIALVLIVAMPLCRSAFGLPYEWWRLSHGMLGGVIVIIGSAHILMVGHSLSTFWLQALWIAITAATLLLLVHVRMITPLRLRAHPWRVVEVRREAERVWTLALEADGHRGITFLPGQFVWLTLRDTPFSLQQHPFSISSSATNSQRIELTIKELGDFTASIASAQPGQRAYLEGPYGRFSCDVVPDHATLILIPGGIGITPMISMLRTLAERGKRRHITLVIAARKLESAPFRDEYPYLASALNLQVIYALEHAPDSAELARHETWTGRAGMLDAAMLSDHLPAIADANAHAFVCGPEPMMDVVERHLLDYGIPLTHLHSERFAMA